MSVSHQPASYHTLTPYLIIKGAAAAIDFYKAIFDATEVMRMTGPDGTIAHAEVKIGDSIIMLSEENPAWGTRSPQALGGSPVGMCLYFPDVDARFDAAVAAGAKVVRPVADQFYGDRSGTVTDPFGHQWTLATHVEDVAPEEMMKRFAQVMTAMQPAA
ncbi:VOC family protein [Gemmata sp.]|uniref:VOC family protein n=1 Tax=Gemmata sp. TaxID=1914242 RepID=UPI003F71684F